MPGMIPGSRVTGLATGDEEAMSEDIERFLRQGRESRDNQTGGGMEGGMGGGMEGGMEGRMEGGMEGGMEGNGIPHRFILVDLETREDLRMLLAALGRRSGPERPICRVTLAGATQRDLGILEEWAGVQIGRGSRVFLHLSPPCIWSGSEPVAEALGPAALRAGLEHARLEEHRGDVLVASVVENLEEAVLDLAELADRILEGTPDPELSLEGGLCNLMGDDGFTNMVEFRLELHRPDHPGIVMEKVRENMVVWEDDPEGDGRRPLSLETSLLDDIEEFGRIYRN